MMSYSRFFLAILVATLFTGCQSSPSPGEIERIERRVANQFERNTLPLNQFVKRHNEEYAFQVKINSSSGDRLSEKLALSNQPPITTQELVAALQKTLSNGYEERSLALIDGVDRPRPIRIPTILTIRKILETGRIPESFRIWVQIAETDTQLRWWTYIPTLRLYDNIVIRQVYLSSDAPAGGETWQRGETWLMPELNRGVDRDRVLRERGLSDKPAAAVEE